MIYITKDIFPQEECSYIGRVWHSEHDDLQKRYADWIAEEASMRGITINKHWLNLMNRKDHNSHLSEVEYGEAEKSWKRFLAKNSFDSYLERTGLATECEFEEVY